MISLAQMRNFYPIIYRRTRLQVDFVSPKLTDLTLMMQNLSANWNLNKTWRLASVNGDSYLSNILNLRDRSGMVILPDWAGHFTRLIVQNGHKF